MLQRPTWTILTAEVESSVRVDDRREVLIERARAEYREMPGLCLTVHQACRLWQIEKAACTRILDVLVAEGFLTRTLTGAFIARR